MLIWYWNSVSLITTFHNLLLFDTETLVILFTYFHPQLNGGSVFFFPFSKKKGLVVHLPILREP